MGTSTEEDTSKLSRTELRKQKLAEYLAAKGRLKPPNPKPYLKDSAALKNPPGAMQRSQTLSRGKENNAPNATALKQYKKMGDPLTEKIKNMNTLTSKQGLRMQPKAHSSSLQHSTFKSSVSQTGTQQCKSHSKRMPTVSVKEQQTKPSFQKGAVTHKQSQVIRESVSVQVKTSCRVSTFRAHASNAKTGSYSGQILRTHVKPPTGTEQLRNMLSSKTETETISGTQSRLTQRSSIKAGLTKPDIGHGLGKQCSGLQTKKPLIRSSQTEKVVSKSQKESVSQLNVPGNKPKLTSMQRKPQLLGSTLSATAPKKSKTNVDRKNALPQTQRTAVKLAPKPTVRASVPQTLPHHSKSSRQTMGAVQPKTPKSGLIPGTQGVRTVPLDERKMTVAQEERMRKLKEWRESRGITYKRPPMPVKPVRRKTTAAVPQGYWTSMEKEDEVHGFVCAVDQSLNDCIKLLQQGCPVDQVKDVLSRVPMAQKFTKYWICQVRLMEREGNLDVLPTFEEAVRVVREPVDELRSVVFEILKKKESKGSHSAQIEEGQEVDGEEDKGSHCDMHTPKPVGALIRGVKGDSSIIKYKITTTPGGKRSQQREKLGRINGSEIRFFTPVRRSLRIEKTAICYPAALQEHDPCVTSLQDLLVEDEGEVERGAEVLNSPLYVYRENDALKEHVNVELVYEQAEALY